MLCNNTTMTHFAGQKYHLIVNYGGQCAIFVVIDTFMGENWPKNCTLQWTVLCNAVLRNNSYNYHQRLVIRITLPMIVAMSMPEGRAAGISAPAFTQD